MKPTISIITPTRNRAGTLNRVFKSLSNQTYKNFEWIVCDDASNDRTIELLKKFKKRVKFNIRIFAFNKRAGKPKIDNFCVKKARGKFVVFADSDDGFKSNSFDNFINEWNKIPTKNKKKIFAIISRCLKPDGTPLEPELNIKKKIISYTSLIYDLKKNKEKWLFINKKILKKFKFPEIDYYVPEGIVWTKIAKNYNLWVLDKCYRIFYSDAKNSITHSNKINYSIGQLEALKIFIKNKYILKKEKKFSLLINFYRFIFINNLFFNYKINSSVNVKNNIKFFAFLIGFILFIKDVLSFNIKNEKFIKNIDLPTKIS